MPSLPVSAMLLIYTYSLLPARALSKRNGCGSVQTELTVVKVQNLRWGNGTFRFAPPPVPGYVHFPGIVTIRGGGTL